MWRRDKIDRSITTLFISVDGKISTGATDDLDVDKDFSKIKGVNEGLHQYYEIEQKQTCGLSTRVECKKKFFPF